MTVTSGAESKLAGAGACQRDTQANARMIKRTETSSVSRSLGSGLPSGLLSAQITRSV